MISQERLEAIVRNGLMDGLNAVTIAKQTGIPLARVQAMAHKINGRDPAKASKDTRKKRRQAGADLPSFGGTLQGPRRR